MTAPAEWISIMPGTISIGAGAQLPDAITPAAAFLRQRYPGLRFEIYIDQPSYQLRELLAGPKPVLNSVWKAYLSSDNSTPNASQSCLNVYYTSLN